MDRFGFESACSNCDVQETRKINSLEKWNTENPSQSIQVKEKMKETNLERYNVEYSSQANEVKLKIKDTWDEKYEGSPMRNDDIKKKRINTLIENHGVDSPMKCPLIFEKHSKSSKKRKQYILPSGNIIYIQGYEPIVLDYLFKMGFKEQEIITRSSLMPKITYIGLDNKEHRYHPDFYIPSLNWFIEVKSFYTYLMQKDINLLKRKACLDLGFKFNFVIR